jgi:isopenicillin N synthase-like dioxygenase
MALPDEAVAAAMWESASNVGFFTVVNHGLAESVVETAFAAAEGFFARPIAEKEAAAPFAPQLNSGYEHMTQVR